jgi:hypothetical protein
VIGFVIILKVMQNGGLHQPIINFTMGRWFVRVGGGGLRWIKAILYSSFFNKLW